MAFVLVVRPDGLDCHSPWKCRQFIRWEDIEPVSYSILLSWFVIHTGTGKKFRVPSIVRGLSSFLDECERKIPLTKLNLAKEGYARLGRLLPGEERFQ